MKVRTGLAWGQVGQGTEIWLDRDQAGQAYPGISWGGQAYLGISWAEQA